MRLALVIDNIVSNIIISDNPITGYEIIPIDIPVAIGWEYDGSTFYAPTPTISLPTKIDRKKAVEIFLNEQAILLGYNSIIEAITYAGETSVSQYNTDALSLRAWRSAVKQAYEAIEADIAISSRIAPTIDELISELPVYGA